MVIGKPSNRTFYRTLRRRYTGATQHWVISHFAKIPWRRRKLFSAARGVGLSDTLFVVIQRAPTLPGTPGLITQSKKSNLAGGPKR
jgi:hypothetical protein